MACAGNSSELCGGPDALNVYKIGPVVPSHVGGWTSLGCYKLYSHRFIHPPSANFTAPFSDSVPARVLANQVNVVGQVSIETCTAACLSAGYSLAGAEYADQCCKFDLKTSVLSHGSSNSIKQSVTINSKTTAYQFQLVLAIWPVSATVQSIVAVRTHSMSITTQALAPLQPLPLPPLFHPALVVGLLLDVTS